MEQALKMLMKRMPPPPDPRFSHVNWTKLEGAVGLTYPASFKEFVDVYGGCVWFDNVSLFYSEAKTDAEVNTFLQSVAANLKWLESNTYDDNFQKLEMPLYPAEGGLLPFVVDYSSGLGCWKTESKDPNKWPVVYWERGPIIILEKMTIAKMILDFLDAKPHMIKVWGDVREYEPERIRLTETTESNREVKTRKKKK